MLVVFSDTKTNPIPIASLSMFKQVSKETKYCINLVLGNKPVLDSCHQQRSFNQLSLKTFLDFKAQASRM